jgi:predicted NUDIX family phosphoesterase
MDSSKSEFLRIAEYLLAKYEQPMSAKKLVESALEEGLFSDKLAGKTPYQTMKAKLSVHIRKNGHRSIFVRTKPGHFYLRRLLDDPKKIYDAQPLQAPVSKERILTFSSIWLDRQKVRFQGIKRSWKQIADSLLEISNFKYIERFQAEQINENKQVLSYIMVTRKSQVLAYKRGSYNRVEDYLRGSHCIGFGGHVAETDRNLFNFDKDFGIYDNAIRELFEELKLPNEDKVRLKNGEGLNIVGLLNDDSSPTGQRHFAFLFQYEVCDSPAWEKPERGEKSITQLRWLKPSSPDFSLWEFEYWSQLCLREYFSSAVHGQPSYLIRRKKQLTPPHILCILGTIGSGKSEATRVLKEDFNYIEINSGQIMAEILGIPPIPKTDREIFQKAAWEFISRPDGPAQLAKAIWEKVSYFKTPRILIDGIRQRATLESLRALAKGRRIGHLFVYTLPDIAYQFYKSRCNYDLSIYDFLGIYDSPVEEEVRSFIGFCDGVLYNWIGRPEYHSAIHSLMGEIGVTHYYGKDYGRWL